MIEVFLVGFLVLLLLGVPLGFSMLLSSILYILTTGTLPLELVPQRVFQGLNHFTWLAIPLFLLAGELMNAGGITGRLVTFVQSAIGQFRGGLAYVTVVTNVGMAGISGSALADAAGTGSVLIRSMQRAGYTTRFSTAVVAASSTVGPVIPPSIPFILYATLAGVSVSQMFAAGAVPGIAMALFFMVVIAMLARRNGFPKERRRSWRERAQAFRDAFFALVMPVIILGGILSGVFTATEAAGVAVLYALVVSIAIYRELDVRQLPGILLTSAKNSAVILFAIGAAGLFAWLMTYSQVAGQLATVIGAMTDSPTVVLLLVSLLLLFLGLFIEATPLIIILTPVLLPVVTALGVDPVHFGLVMVLVLMIGLVTPPVGMVLFITAGIGRTNVIEVARGCVPFMAAMIAVVILAVVFPSWVMWLPGLLAD
ncbi:TRAP transporter large permease [Pseudonocardia kunmingensis]|uniref:Tripartite ATP-independent transporter DctM subunit n=1 Tax=Pseudonocardia kunmingensis TaxID=630975 RepID=A0A543DVP5_9PSEU|nr:TRAP transporter large permease [Pseudonocardia kunmingensis]TQM13383.1 tripartite ATP-independent transporter DctM subunit [Pseudonocardia kunmingensis]